MCIRFDVIHERDGQTDGELYFAAIFANVLFIYLFFYGRLILRPW